MYRQGCGKTLAVCSCSNFAEHCHNQIARVHALIEHSGQSWSVELDRPTSISLPLRRDFSNCRAYFLPPMEIVPLCTDQFTGSIASGGIVNCDRLVIHTHGNSTHTECLRHVVDLPIWISEAPRFFLVIGQLLTVEPKNNTVITADQIISLDQDPFVRAVVIRTLPNDSAKAEKNWSGTNPPYLSEDAARFLSDREIEHLLIDLPSIDPEDDGGALRAHRAFWSLSDSPRVHATITELCFIPDTLSDGFYLVQLGILPLESDASPSHVLLYPAKRL